MGHLEIDAPPTAALVRLTLDSGQTCGASRRGPGTVTLVLPWAATLVDRGAVLECLGADGELLLRRRGLVTWREGAAPVFAVAWGAGLKFGKSDG